MVSPAGSGSEGLIEMRGRSFTGADEPTWAGAAAGGSLGRAC
jgi:hypothetical protein